MIKIIIAPILTVICLLVSSCGQSGGLYLPTDAPPSSQQQQEG